MMSDYHREITVIQRDDRTYWVQSSAPFSIHKDHFAVALVDLESKMLSGLVEGFDVVGDRVVEFRFSEPGLWTKHENELLEAFALGATGLDCQILVCDQGNPRPRKGGQVTKDEKGYRHCPIKELANT